LIRTARFHVTITAVIRASRLTKIPTPATTFPRTAGAKSCVPVMFNNIVYFIIVLLVFEINHPDKTSGESFSFFLAMLFLTWMAFAAYCHWGFQTLRKRFKEGVQAHGSLAIAYHRLTGRLAILSVFLFALTVYVLNMKYWIQKIPGCDQFSSLQGLCAILLFFVYLSTIWYFACPCYRTLFRQEITRRSYIRSNLRLNLPILFPWIVLALLIDLISLSPLRGVARLFTGFGGNLLFFAGFIVLLMIYMPGIIQYWWGCRPLPDTTKSKTLRTFLESRGFKYRELLNWPIFEGQMMTAGIMGFLPRYRYILITDSLMEILNTEELKAVMAHEMGHAKYRHLLFYVLFLLGFMVVSFGLQDFLEYLLYMHPFITKMMSSGNSQSINAVYLALSLPMLVILVVYFRYIMGFFMRNFERQADLYAAGVMGSPGPVINSLKKIAYFSGKTMDVPSWHHFSIRQRIDCLMKTLEEPGLIGRHNRFLAMCFLGYLTAMIVLGYTLNFSPLKQRILYSVLEKELNERIQSDPENISLYQDYAMVCNEMGKYDKAIRAYETIIALDPDQALALNNLAWILVTCPDKRLRNPGRGLELAQKAVTLERSAVFLDTLAEAYYENGFIRKAIQTSREALVAARENRQYYDKQLKKFLASGRKEKGVKSTFDLL